MKLRQLYDNYLDDIINYMKEWISDSIIYIIGTIILAIINASIALFVREFYYYPDVFLNFNINIFNLSILYLLVIIIWYIILKNIDDFFE